MIRTSRFTGPFLLALVAVLTLLPFISMATTALQPQGTTPHGLGWPSHPQWHNFVDAWNVAEMLPLLGSTGLIVITVVPLAVLFATMAGYGLAQLRPPGHGVVTALFIIGLTLPIESILTPLYFEIRKLGLLNSQFGIALPLLGIYMPFAVFWMRGHFLNLPRELSEAGQIDGANTWQLFRRIHLPLAVPAWSSLAMLLTMWTSNQFLLAIVLVNDSSKRTLAGALAAFQGERTTNVVLVCAAALLVMAPMLTLFVLFQRRFSEALLQGIAK